MVLPEYVMQCLQRLENAGFPCYAVGGCVRDSLLGLTPHDYDLCTAATPEQIKAVFADLPLVLAGEKHGTVGVITEKNVVEITTFRTEGAYQDNRHPDWVEFVDRIEADLARRDFTVNAMAWSPVRGLADPFGGRQDLENKVLRAVGVPEKRFQEDSLRILRGVRFAVRYGLTPDAATQSAMFTLASLMENLARERVFDELCKLLPLVNAKDLLRFAPVITQVIPELACAVGFDQRNSHHAYDVYTHIALVTETVPPKLSLRWAALLHDVGKVASFSMGEDGQGHYYGHAELGEEMANAILRRLKAPTQLREQVLLLIRHHMTRLQPDKKLLRRWLGKLGEETIGDLLHLQEADMGSKGTGMPEELKQFPLVRQLLEEIREENSCLHIRDLAVNGHDLMALGFSGPKIGECMNRLLELVQEEKLENTRQALLAEAQRSGGNRT